MSIKIRSFNKRYFRIKSKLMYQNKKEICKEKDVKSFYMFHLFFTYFVLSWPIDNILPSGSS